IKDIQRKEIPEYPIEVTREAITNAVMHRNYFEKGANVFVNIFDDRMEIYNPGGLPKGLSIKDFGKKCVRRNPLIADLLHRTGYVEKAGTGMFRMEEAMKERGLSMPKIEITSFFTIIFKPVKKKVGEKRGEKWGEKWGKKWGEKLSENQEEIISLINSDKSISIIEIAKKTRLGTTAIENNIANLKQKNLLKRIGPAKGGYWEIVG
ncbi:transcriptional regulator, partial [Candidatus Parcubacteria bacterium]|nr:transcriptional regulator [Candidatus Parcubacteria bacterium]